MSATDSAMKAAATTESAAEPLLRVRDLKVHFPIHGGVFRRVVDHVRAVDGVSFDVPRGATVGLVGESGSGKTTIGRAIVRLNRITAGSITYDGVDITRLNRRQFFPYRKRIQMVFQDPFNSLDPRMT
ncbi:MAG: ATP-binding cassette domain-containing protein, partial [Chromatiales bacterium]|nr:ATP-binding cassette domain-containing protein [Chromatiales bacterium]